MASFTFLQYGLWLSAGILGAWLLAWSRSDGATWAGEPGPGALQMRYLFLKVGYIGLKVRHFVEMRLLKFRHFVAMRFLKGRHFVAMCFRKARNGVAVCSRKLRNVIAVSAGKIRHLGLVSGLNLSMFVFKASILSKKLNISLERAIVRRAQRRNHRLYLAKFGGDFPILKARDELFQ